MRDIQDELRRDRERKLEQQFRYDLDAHRYNHQRIRAQGENDTAVAAQLEREWNLKARARRAEFHIVDERSEETSFDRIREGRSAT